MNVDVVRFHLPIFLKEVSDSHYQVHCQAETCHAKEKNFKNETLQFTDVNDFPTLA
jgi:hypothetical protein